MRGRGLAEGNAQGHGIGGQGHCQHEARGAAIFLGLFAPDVLGLAEIRSKLALGLMSALTATAMLLRIALAPAWR